MDMRYDEHLPPINIPVYRYMCNPIHREFPEYDM